MRARLETPALLGSHLGSRFEREATDAAVRVEWNRQQARPARGTEACDRPFYPSAAVTTECTGQKDRSMSRLSLGEIAAEAP
ncbi:hypothetical protein Q8A67_010970 [Cirrhinus molitorella]|uniref:Uncharacterized protein n=1 Tax=Cirrhinus molitorella TaxID=172907 RepID=A0AA88TP48_9TELE|nr:hypothetical protein Q8A67_010970 [Cirrhinus molitorella]